MKNSNVAWNQAGRDISTAEVQEICETVKMFPRLDRRELACTICEQLEWFTASGSPKSQACLNLLAKLEGQGILQLPALREDKRKCALAQGKPVRISDRTKPGEPLRVALSACKPVAVEPVTEKGAIGLWNEYVERYHPLKYKKPFGHRLRYFIKVEGGVLGCLLLSGAAKSIGIRDEWIGWNDQVRLKNLGWVLNNSRFLLLPWVEVPHLASHVLGKLSKRVAEDYEARWGFRPFLLETFVDPASYRGTCYRAAGWKELGRTTGEGLKRVGKNYTTTPKLLFVKPLSKDFRHKLSNEELKGGWEDA
jgi:hypothetical protein